MGLRSFEKSGHISKRTAWTVYGLLNLPLVILLVVLFVSGAKWWVVMAAALFVIANVVVGWVVYDGAYGLDDSDTLIDRRPRQLNAEEQAMRNYERNPNAETAERLQRMLKK